MGEDSRKKAGDSKHFFYGWYMVGAGSALQFLQAALMTAGLGSLFFVLAKKPEPPLA